MKKQKKNDIFKRKNVDEKDFLHALENISKKLIYKFKFGYHEIEDMKQQAAIFAIEGLENYDNKRPLENFLWTHVRNRLFNFKRDNYFRPDNVCIGCPFFDPKFKKSDNQCSKFKDKNDCSIYSEWTHRNQTKKNIMHPSSIDNEKNQNLSNETNDVLNNISNKEILSLIEKHIHTKYRETYLKLKGGSKVTKVEVTRLQKHIKQILDEHKNG
jgi:hypothetical protein